MLEHKHNELYRALSPEARLIARASQARPSSETIADLRDLIEGGISWSFVERQVPHHGVEALIHRNLSAFQSSMPEEVYEMLSRRSHSIALWNLRQMRELMQVLKVLEEEEIPVIPFKGPILAALAYDDVSARRFVDLDIMVRREDIERAKRLLYRAGYRSARDLNAEGEEEHIDSQMGYEFFHPEKKVVVEVHWAFFFDIYAFELKPEDVWDRHQRVHFSGMEVRVFSPEDLLIYLCAHGTKHRWMKLKWIADVAAHVRSQVIDWSVVEKRAKRLGCMRMVHLGLLLASALLNLKIDESSLVDGNRSRSVQAMARQVCSEWLFRDPDADDSPVLDVFLFHVKERDRWRDRWPYIKHHLQLWFDSALTRSQTQVET